MATKKLHELLAVVRTLKGQAEATRADLRTTFEKKRNHFHKRLVTFTPAEEGGAAVTEEQLDLQTTVGRELKWIKGIIAGAIDVAYQVEVGNAVARADVVLDDGTVLAQDVPATALLELEKRADEVEQLVKAVPTLDPAKAWTQDRQQGAGVFVARPETKTRTRKVQKALVLYPATPEHPAQTQLVSIDEPSGTVTTQEWSGLLTVDEKGQMLERAEALKRAIKAARSRANDVPVDVEAKVADALLGYVFGQ